MLKLLFNNDGSVRDIVLPKYVTQGSSGELDALKLSVGFADSDITESGNTVIARFRLPNGDVNALTFNINETMEVKNDTYPCKSVYLTEAQTYYSGLLFVSIEVLSNGGSNILYTYNCRITVNPTTYQPQSENTNISNAQYENLAVQIEYLQDNVITTNTDDLVNYYTKTESDNKYALKEGALPSYSVASTDSVLNFITNNDVNNKPIVIKIGNYPYIGVLNHVSGIFNSLRYELEMFDNVNQGRQRYAGSISEPTASLSFSTLLDNSRLDNFESENRKVTSISSSSTNTEYPSAKCVYDALVTLETHLDSKYVNVKTTTGTFVYTHNGSTEGEVAYTSSVTADAIVQRKSDGQISVPQTPSATTDATSKSYVDSSIADAQLGGTVSVVDTVYPVGISIFSKESTFNPNNLFANTTWTMTELKIPTTNSVAVTTAIQKDGDFTFENDNANYTYAVIIQGNSGGYYLNGNDGDGPNSGIARYNSGLKAESSGTLTTVTLYMWTRTA